MKEVRAISIKEINDLIQKGSTSVVDIREPWKFHEKNLGGQNIPSHELTEKYHLFNQSENVVVVCSSGMISSIMARVLSKKLPHSQLYYLQEGLD